MFSNWKTLILGLGAGAFNMLANGTNWKQVLLSVAVAGLGVVSKDFNVTGGTVKQAPTASGTPTKEISK